MPIGMHAVIEPGSTDRLVGRGGGDLLVFGRMRPGADQTRTTAAAELFARQLAGAYPATNADLTAMLVPAGVGFDHPGYVKPAVLVLSSALGLFGSLVILAIICANLANLQLARATARSRETAIRLSLGCSRGRLTRQLLVESAVLALPGCAIALALIQANGVAERYLVPKLQFQVGLAAEHRCAGAAVHRRGGGARGRALRPGAGDPGIARGRRASSGERGSRRRPAAADSAARWSSSSSRSRWSCLVGGMLFVRSLAAARALDSASTAATARWSPSTFSACRDMTSGAARLLRPGADAGPGTSRRRRRGPGPAGAVRYLWADQRLVRRRPRQFPRRHHEHPHQRRLRWRPRGARASARGRARLHAG